MIKLKKKKSTVGQQQRGAEVVSTALGQIPPFRPDQESYRKSPAPSVPAQDLKIASMFARSASLGDVSLRASSAPGGNDADSIGEVKSHLTDPRLRREDSDRGSGGSARSKKVGSSDSGQVPVVVKVRQRKVTAPGQGIPPPLPSTPTKRTAMTRSASTPTHGINSNLAVYTVSPPSSSASPPPLSPKSHKRRQRMPDDTPPSSPELSFLPDGHLPPASPTLSAIDSRRTYSPRNSIYPETPITPDLLGQEISPQINPSSHFLNFFSQGGQYADILGSPANPNMDSQLPQKPHPLQSFSIPNYSKISSQFEAPPLSRAGSISTTGSASGSNVAIMDERMQEAMRQAHSVVQQRGNLRSGSSGGESVGSSPVLMSPTRSSDSIPLASPTGWSNPAASSVEMSVDTSNGSTGRPRRKYDPMAAFAAGTSFSPSSTLETPLATPPILQPVAPEATPADDVAEVLASPHVIALNSPRLPPQRDLPQPALPSPPLTTTLLPVESNRPEVVPPRRALPVLPRRTASTSGSEEPKIAVAGASELRSRLLSTPKKKDLPSTPAPNELTPSPAISIAVLPATKPLEVKKRSGSPSSSLALSSSLPSILGTPVETVPVPPSSSEASPHSPSFEGSELPYASPPRPSLNPFPSSIPAQAARPLPTTPFPLNQSSSQSTTQISSANDLSRDLRVTKLGRPAIMPTSFSVAENINTLTRSDSSFFNLQERTSNFDATTPMPDSPQSPSFSHGQNASRTNLSPEIEATSPVISTQQASATLEYQQLEQQLQTERVRLLNVSDDISSVPDSQRDDLRHLESKSTDGHSSRLTASSTMESLVSSMEESPSTSRSTLPVIDSTNEDGLLTPNATSFELEDQQGDLYPSPSFASSYASLKDVSAHLSPILMSSTVPIPPPGSYPLWCHVGQYALFGPLLKHLSFPDWLALFSTSRIIRQLISADDKLRELVTARFLRFIGYKSWSRDFGRKEVLALNSNDLNAYFRGFSLPAEEYQKLSYAILQRQTSDPALLPLLQACTRHFSRVVMRLKLQATAQIEQVDRARLFAQRSSLNSSLGSHMLKRPMPSVDFKSPLYKAARAALFRCFVPSESAWLSDDAVVACEDEMKKAGIWKLLEKGDIVWNTAVYEDGNAGHLIFDGNYLIDLDYSFSAWGEIPASFNSFQYAPSYWHKIIRTPGSPLVYLDLTAYLNELKKNLKLVQEKGAVANTSHSRGKGSYMVAKWVHRTEFTVTASDVVHKEWAGVIVLQCGGTNEALVDLRQRFERPGRTPYRIIRERSKPGEIWIRPVTQNERLRA